jgi:hypothetical protein
VSTTPDAAEDGGILFRTLSRLTDIRANEVRVVAWAWLYIFAVLSSYYIMRPIREQMGVAGGDRVAGVEHDLALQPGGVFAPDFWQRFVRNGHQDDIPERDRLLHSAGACIRTGACDQVFQFLRMP